MAKRSTGAVEIRRRRWWPFQRGVVMAPMGHIHIHPAADFWSEDFSRARLSLQGLLIHELCHVWQWQQGIFLPLRRHPFCRYDYVLEPGKPFAAMAWSSRPKSPPCLSAEQGLPESGAETGRPDRPSLAAYRAVLPFDRLSRRNIRDRQHRGASNPSCAS
jgi:hypothetical protein